MASLLITVIVPLFLKVIQFSIACTKNTTARYKNLMIYENEINEHLLIDFV